MCSSSMQRGDGDTPVTRQFSQTSQGTRLANGEMLSQVRPVAVDEQ
jgi:hypothetical protein